MVCPYGRLQGVLLDRNSLVILYDWIRGEPRGKGKRQENDGKGDCIDCGLCVQVCPTGIDIRNGTQLECVNCTACIDVCDSVMNKVGKEPGLIRFDSVNGVEQGNRKVMTPRAWAYSAILFILSGVVILLLATRSQVETVFLRMEGQIYQKDGTKIVNIYDYTLINKSDEAMQLRFEPIDQSAELILIGEDVIVLDPEEIRHGSAMLKIEREELTASKIKVKLLVLDEDGNEIDQISTNFLGPLVRK